MITYLYLATAAGLFIAAQTNGEWCIVGQALTEHSLTSVVVSEGVILAGTVDGIWRSSDKGKSWNKADKHLTIPYVRWLAGSSNAPKIILAGTEPANIFVSHDGGHTWNRCAFCSMYKTEKFEVRSPADIKQDIDSMHTPV